MATREERQQIRDSHKDSWIAVDPGDVIAGKVVDVTEAWSDQRRDPITNRPGSYYPLLTLQVEEANGYDSGSELKVHAFGAVLFNEVMRKQPGIGESIRITYRGPGKAKPGQNPPELYTVRAAAGTDSARRAYSQIPMRRTQPGAESSAPAEPEQLDVVGGDDLPF